MLCQTNSCILRATSSTCLGRSWRFCPASPGWLDRAARPHDMAMHNWNSMFLDAAAASIWTNPCDQVFCVSEQVRHSANAKAMHSKCMTCMQRGCTRSSAASALLE